jgi:hypothetical protein
VYGATELVRAFPASPHDPENVLTDDGEVMVDVTPLSPSHGQDERAIRKTPPQKVLTVSC